MKYGKDNKNSGLTDKEIQDQLDRYSVIGGNMKTYFKFQRMKKDFIQEKQRVEENRNKAVPNFAMAERSGIPQSYERVKYNHEQEDQIRNDRVAEENREEYRTTNSLSKEFKETKDSKKDVLKVSFNKMKNNERDR